MNKTETHHQAINLMIEDLYTVHERIRTEAKLLECEDELIQLRDDIVEFLKSKR